MSATDKWTHGLFDCYSSDGFKVLCLSIFCAPFVNSYSATAVDDEHTHLSRKTVQYCLCDYSGCFWFAPYETAYKVKKYKQITQEGNAKALCLEWTSLFCCSPCVTARTYKEMYKRAEVVNASFRPNLLLNPKPVVNQPTPLLKL